MYALGEVESGGSYTAYNSSTGAYGKYQIIPSSWRAWAEEVLGDPYAPKTPENQDAIAAYKLHQTYHRVGSWPPVAYWWLTGRLNTDRSTWSSFARYYVDKIMKIYSGTSAIQAAPAYPTAWYQETYRYIGWSGTWSSVASNSYAGGSARTSITGNSWTHFRFEGRAVTWIGPKGPKLGVAKVYIDGAYARTVDAGSSVFDASEELFSRTWSGSGIHTLSIRVVGTEGRPTIGVDQFKVTK